MAKQKIEGKQKQNSYLLRLLEAVGPIRFLLVDEDQLQVGVVVLVLKHGGANGSHYSRQGRGSLLQWRGACTGPWQFLQGALLR